MKHWLICGAILAAVLLSGEKAAGTDIGKLEPTRVLLIESQGGAVAVSTDAGHWGLGEDLTDAVDDMQHSASGVVFLDTVEYLLLSPSAVNRFEEVSALLRNSCQLCLVYGVEDLEAAGDYLAIHQPGITVGDCRKNTCVLPVLYMEGDRMKLAYP